MTQPDHSAAQAQPQSQSLSQGYGQSHGVAQPRIPAPDRTGAEGEAADVLTSDQATVRVQALRPVEPARPVRSRLSRTAAQAGILLAPFLLFGLFLQLYGVNPAELYLTMFKGTFGDWYGFGEVLVKAAPIILTALAAALPAKAGLINVGGEGQLAIGALTATAAGVFLLGDLPAFVGIPLMILAGALGGAAWAGFTAVLKVKGRMNETIVSLLLNYVAVFTVGYFVHGLLKDPASFNWPFSPEISPSLRLPVVDGTRLHLGIVIALAAAAAAWFVIVKTRLGYRIRIIGSNSLAALRAGIPVGRTQFWVLVAAGAVAGIAGMIEIAGIEGRLRPSTGATYGYLGFLASWMAWNHPLALIGTGFMLGMISVAGNSLEINSGLPSSSVHILMALVLFFLLGFGRTGAPGRRGGG